jgi:diguanylate cyclase (GGDEF)-like protein
MTASLGTSHTPTASATRAGSVASEAISRVLLIHDDPMWLMHTGRELRERGFLVTECTRPYEVGDLIDQSHPDAVVIDAAVREPAAYVVCQQIRQHPGGDELPVLLLASDASSESHRLAQDAGVTDFSVGETDAAMLVHRLRQMLWVSRLERTLGAGGQPMHPRSPARSGRFVWRTDSGEVRGTEDLFGLVDRRVPDGVADAGWLLDILSKRERRRLMVSMQRLLRGGQVGRLEIEIRTHSSGQRRVRIEVQQVIALNAQSFEVTGHVYDVSPTSNADARVYRLTHYDTLTGLPNRAWFVAQLKVGPRRGAQGLGLALLDIDRYHEVLEAFGQDACDRLIVEVAQRLRRLSRSALPQWGQGASRARIAAVAYLGGDEFGLILEHLAEPDESLEVCRNVLNVLSESIRLGERELFLNASIGVHAADPAQDDPIGWLGRAELARRAAAALSTERVLRFDPSMSETATDRLMMERDLHYAMERGELSMQMQPKFAASTRTLIGFEALMRWSHRGQMQSPARFIPIAERNGLIVPMGEWAIDQACAMIGALARAGRSDCRVSVNLSAQQLSDGRLPELIEAALARHGVPAERLEVELTESGLMHDPELALAVLRAIRALGVGLAIDDFGTGYSSLAYLTRLPLTTLKIDRSFVQDAHLSERSRAVASAIVGLAVNLRLEVIAEGVETEAQRDALIALGCDHQQGYLFGRAMPMDDAIQFARSVHSATRPAQERIVQA